MSDIALSKIANCFFPDAATSGSVRGPARSAVHSYGKRHGGLWVGGRVRMRAGRIWFTPNRANRMAHSNLGDQGVDLAEVVSVEVRPGVLTKIVEVSTGEEMFRFRCFGAKAAARTIRLAVDQARGQGPR